MSDDVEARISDLEAKIDRFEKTLTSGVWCGHSTIENVGKTVVDDLRRLARGIISGKPY